MSSPTTPNPNDNNNNNSNHATLISPTQCAQTQEEITNAIVTPTSCLSSQQSQISPCSPRTRVNGKGLWRAWTRNFQSPQLALLDLIDNAVDAALKAPPTYLVVHDDDNKEGTNNSSNNSNSNSNSNTPMTPFQGRIHISPDRFLPKASSTAPPIITGISIINNSNQNIRPLSEILEVYTSKKKGRHSIGENGVGLKQGCATLSDLSFVLVIKKQVMKKQRKKRKKKKNKRSIYSLGIIAKSLQSEDGCFLPSFEFEARNTDELRVEMRELFMHSDTAADHDYYENNESLMNGKNRENIARCIAAYGGGNGEAEETDHDSFLKDESGFLRRGIDRLVLRFMQLSGEHKHPSVKNVLGDDACDEDWGCDDSDVFCLILHGLKHGKQSSPRNSPRSEDNKEEEEGNPECSVETKRLLSDLERDLPWHYIHIPEEFNIRICNKPIRFHHWQRRLVEPAVFYVKIDENIAWNAADSDNSTTTSSSDDDDTSFHQPYDWRDPPQGYYLRIFTGFDRFFLKPPATSTTTNKTNNNTSACTLCIYSRTSGRLIKHSRDGRPLLNLTQTGTTFAQGLTVLVDDMMGKLPLDPTKQSIGFSERRNGRIHESNLYAWVGAVTHFYYSYQLEKKCGGLKRVLTERVSSWGQDDDDDDDGEEFVVSDVKPLDQSDYTTFRNIPWYRFQKKFIRASRKDICEVSGADSVRRIQCPSLSSSSFSSMKKKKQQEEEQQQHQKVDRKRKSADSASITTSESAATATKKKKKKNTQLSCIDNDSETTGITPESNMDHFQINDHNDDDDNNEIDNNDDVIVDNDPFITKPPTTVQYDEEDDDDSSDDDVVFLTTTKPDDASTSFPKKKKDDATDTAAQLSELTRENSILQEEFDKERRKRRQLKFLCQAALKENEKLKKRLKELKKEVRSMRNC